MPKKMNIDSLPASIFEEAMQGTKRLHHQKVSLKVSKHPINKVIRQKDKDPLLLDEKREIAFVSGEQPISYKQESIPHKILRKLKKGQYNVDAVLDLHGMIVEDAIRAVSVFLESCLEEEMRVVMIIHGKGRHSHSPILKNKLNNWLRGLAVVLAFCSASVADGHRGAVYVLLKQTKEETFRG